MGYRPQGAQSVIGPQLMREYGIHRQDELLGVSSVNER